MHHAVAQWLRHRLTGLLEQAIQDEQFAAQLDESLSQLPVPSTSPLAVQRDQAVATRNSAQSQLIAAQRDGQSAEKDLQKVRQSRVERDRGIADARQELAVAQNERDHAQHDLEAAKRAPPSLIKLEGVQGNDRDYSILHADCQAKVCVLIRTDEQGRPSVVARISTDRLDATDSPFHKALIELQKNPNPLVLFWVRPDGINTFETANSLLPKDVSYGYEPADPALRLDFPVKP